MFRIVLAACVVAGAIGCSPEARRADGLQDRVGVWKVRSSVNRLTDQKEVFLVAETTNVRAASRLSGANIGILNVTCDLVLMLFGGPIGGPRNAVVSVRADSKSARGDLFEVGDNLQSIKAPRDRARAAIQYMIDADNLYVQVSSATLGITSVDLRISGLKDAMAAAEMSCR